MASCSDVRFAITKLNNINYQLWKFKLEMLLNKDDLWQVLNTDRITNRPTVEWDRRNKQARAIISLLVEDDQLIHRRKENI